MLLGDKIISTGGENENETAARNNVGIAGIAAAAGDVVTNAGIRGDVYVDGGGEYGLGDNR